MSSQLPMCLHGPECGHAAVKHEGHIGFLHESGALHCYVRTPGSNKYKVEQHEISHSFTCAEACECVESISIQEFEREHMIQQPVPAVEEIVAKKENASLPFKIVLVLTAMFFVVELVGGIITGSLALKSDAFHMASDVIALVIGVVAASMAGKPALSQSSLTYGYLRGEGVAGLCNGVFLLAVCFIILLEAIERCTDISGVKGSITGQENVVLAIGAIGLGFNIVGLFVFHSHSHHGHSHGSSSESVHAVAAGGTAAVADAGVAAAGAACAAVNQHDHDHGHGHEHHHEHAADDDHCESGHGSHNHQHEHGIEMPCRSSSSNAHAHANAPHSHNQNQKPQSKQKEVQQKKHQFHGHSHSHGHGHSDTGHSANVHGVLLHVMGDALGSIAVIFSTLVIKYGESLLGDARFYADPIASILITVIIAVHTVPFVRACVNIMLQRAPVWLDVTALKAEVLQLAGVLGIHDLHVWQIDGSRVVATAHVSAVRGTDVTRLLHSIHTVMHARGLHASTIQTELVSVAVTAAAAAASSSGAGESGSGACEPLLLMCSDTLCSDAACKDKVCCIL